MPGMNHLDLHFLGTGDCGVEVVNLEPQKHSVSIGSEIRIADRAVMVSPRPIDAIAAPAVRSNSGAHTRGRHVYFDNQADVDTNDYSLRHLARKLAVVGALQLAFTFHRSLMASIVTRRPLPIFVMADRW
jgi:hypothetical protein